MSTVSWDYRSLPMTPLGAPGELVLDSGGGRVPTPAEHALLNVAERHAVRRPTALPYRYQDSYGREPRPVRQRMAVLDNGHLRAEFLLDLGGRLWSLRDMATGRELLHRPDVIQLANLAVRNAWFAGGVEWNLGVTGHWGLTCEPVCAGVVDGEVLRMWAYERILDLIWRVDVWLPDDSEALYTHVVIKNSTDEDKPVYWWSNIAVPQVDDTQVLVDAVSGYHFSYATELAEVSVPIRDGVDISRPQYHRGSADYFFKPPAPHPWIAAVDGVGYGLGQASTGRLVGRKLFTWGNGSGGRAWQQWLSGDGTYAEIQAGLATTQLEHLRLPAGETWRFTESYRPIWLADGRDYRESVSHAGRATVDAEALEAAHDRLTRMEECPVEIIDGFSGGLEAHGWGGLELAAGHMRPDPATPFDPNSLTDEQRAWWGVVLCGHLDEALQTSAMVGHQWRRHVETAEPTWLRELLLGHMDHADGDTEQARVRWTASAREHATPDALRALAVTSDDVHEKADLLTRAHRLNPARAGLAAEAIDALIACGAPDRALAVTEALSDDLRTLPRIQYLECLASVRTGALERAARLIEQPLVLPDLREGDLSLDALWTEYQRARGGHEPLPAHYDFRMVSEDVAWT